VHGQVGPMRVGWVGKIRLGNKNIMILAETLSKLRFLVVYSSSTLSTSKKYGGWVRREGYDRPDLGEKSFQLSSLLIV
jgi:hypothetical protein